MQPFDYLVECNFTESATPIDDFYTSHIKHELFLLLDGDLTALINSQRYRIQNGALVLLPAGDFHRITNNRPGEIYKRITIHFDPKVIQMYNTKNTNLLACFGNQTAGRRNIILLSEDQTRKYIGYASNIAPFWGSEMYGDDITAITSLTLLLLMINRIYALQKAPKPLPSAPFITELVRYIDANISRGLTVGELAKHFSYSESYLSTLFADQMGLTLKHYLTSRKIACAKELLSDNVSVSAACEKSGFNDYCNFIRTFKKTCGCTPKQWQKQNRKNPGS